MSVCHIPPEGWTGREDPEDGALARRMHHLESVEGRVGLLGFACDAGVVRNQGRPGAAEGPTALRQALRNLAAPENSKLFRDMGDIRVSDNDLENGQLRLAEHITSGLTDLDRLVVLGGGHETAFGSWMGLRQAYPDASIGIINFDAHLDIRQPGEAGPSSGTPFYQIHNEDPDQFDYLVLGLAEESNTQALFNRARDWNVEIVTDHELIADVNTGLSAIRNQMDRHDVIYVTVCLDVLPAWQAPGVSAPAARGVSFQILERMIDFILSHAVQANIHLPLIDIVELNPLVDRDNSTSRLAAILARKLISC